MSTIILNKSAKMNPRANSTQRKTIAVLNEAASEPKYFISFLIVKGVYILKVLLLYKDGK